MMNKYTLTLFLLLIVVSCSTQIEITIGEFEKGIKLNKKTGKYSEQLLGSGTHTYNKNEEILIYNIGEVSNNYEMVVFNEDSVMINVIVEYKYQVQEENIIELNNEIGLNFEKYVIMPQITSWMKNIQKKSNKEVIIDSIQDDRIASLIETLSSKYYIDLLTLNIKNN